ncbi:hypothetical protein ACJIZ3_006500 [Penstemon smallii]|uniref:Helitron helicase-like domain-containing protein n=1 Tax=Penstemon smallii TaxID=265156 RepID=A0ABD3S7W4_9LAMI
MDRSSEQRDSRNRRQRERYAALSDEERQRLALRRRANYTRRVSTAVVSSLPPSDEFPYQVHDGVSPLADNLSSDVVRGPCSARPIDPFSMGANFEVGQSSSTSAIVHNEVEIQRGPASRFDRIMEVPTVPWVLPTASSCLHCGARRFFREGPAFCCSNKQICLPQSRVCAILHFLFTDMSEIAYEFRQRGRTYNNGFAFTSIGMSTDADSWLAKEGIYALKVFGQVFHYMNPVDGTPNSKDLLQLFFLDSIDELDQSIVEAKGLRSDIMSLIVDALSSNPYSVFFKRLRSWDNLRDTHVVLRKNPCADQRTHNLPTVDEVAAIWRDVPEGDIGCQRDIRVYTDGSRGHKIRYYYGCYDPLQYPILFPYGETGWHAGIKKKKGIAPSTSASLEEPCSGFDAVAPVNLPSAEAVLLQEERGMCFFTFSHFI